MTVRILAHPLQRTVTEAAKAMLANPDIGVTQIAHRFGVSPATLYRYIPARTNREFTGRLTTARQRASRHVKDREEHNKQA